MKVKIVSLGKEDAFYPDRKELIGKVGYFKENYKGKYWLGGYFAPTKKKLKDENWDSDDFYVFAYVRVEKVK